MFSALDFCHYTEKMLYSFRKEGKIFLAALTLGSGASVGSSHGLCMDNHTIRVAVGFRHHCKHLSLLWYLGNTVSTFNL